MGGQKVGVSVVIPTLNEGKNIGKVLQGVRRVLKGNNIEIIVVDGHSTDDTVELAKKHGARILYDNQGKGSALIKGLHAANGEIVISMDADLSHEPKELTLLVNSIAIGYDLCTGSRFIAGGSTEDMTFVRILGNKFFVMLVNLLFGAHYTDICYGYRSFNRRIIPKLNLKEKGFGIETEINIKAVKKGLKVIEVPSTEKKRNAGEGKLRTFRDGYIILKAIIVNAFSR
ncbi:MAG: glycosyltransferase family 2 protein [Candidatus Micrarchaeota archaeon]|nr:glycosyltransferase family 2 protein [Candidatus Micrarchaeota archaeon]